MKHILCEMENCSAQWNVIVVYVIYILKLPSCLRIKVIIIHLVYLKKKKKNKISPVSLISVIVFGERMSSIVTTPFRAVSSQNGPKLIKTAPTAVADWSKRPPKTAPNGSNFKLGFK